MYSKLTCFVLSSLQAVRNVPTQPSADENADNNKCYKVIITYYTLFSSF